MKIGQSVGTTTTNIVSTSKQEMTVDPRGFGKIMSMFSNQYSDRALAVVREYFCNGDDSRMAAGSDRPTEVFLPTDLNPEILIRDFGTGLNKHGLTTVFSTYTFSTKDNENNSTGGLGIGSKVAFTLGRQFTVTGFKDGVKTVVLFALNDKGVGEWDVRFEGPTEEPNGVLVSVGVPDVAAMRRAAEKFFLTVPKGRALVDGEEPKHLSDTFEFTQFNDDVTIVKDGQGEIRLQMGPVVYRVSKSILQAVRRRLDGLDAQSVAESLIEWDSSDSVLMEAPIGNVDIAPSREDLIDTDPTVNTVTAIVQGIHTFIITDVQAKIDAQPTRWQATMVLNEALSALEGFKVGRKAFLYNGMEKAFKTEVKIEAPTIFLRDRSWRTTIKVVEIDTNHVVDASRMSRTLVVAGVLAEEVGKVKRYAKRFIEENEHGYQWIVVTEEFSGEVEWFQWGIEGGVTTWTLDEYRAVLRGMRDTNPRTANEPSYTTGWGQQAERDLDSRDLLTDIISWGKPISIAPYDSCSASGEVRALLAEEDKYTRVVLMGQQSEAALRKRVAADGSVEVYEGNPIEEAEVQIREKVKAEIPAPTDDERVALGAAEWLQGIRGYRRSTSTWTERLVDAFGGLPTPIQHPVIEEWADAIELATLLAADLTDERKADLSRLKRWTGVDFEAIEYATDLPTAQQTFPLLTDSYGSVAFTQIQNTRDGGRYRKDALAYINSKA